MQMQQANSGAFGTQAVWSTPPYAAAPPLPMQLRQANMGMFGQQSMGPPRLVSPAPMPFESPHDMVQYMQRSQGYVLGPTTAPIQPAAPRFVAPPIGQVPNAMFNHLEVRNPQVSEPTQAPVHLAATTVETSAVRQAANADQKTLKVPSAVEEYNRNKIKLSDMLYAPYKRRFDREQAEKRAQAGTASQRQNTTSKGTAECAQRAASALTV